MATDGEIGHVSEFYFDDLSWTIRYLIVDTGPWLIGRKVLISPVALRAIDWESKALGVRLTKEQVRSSPDIDTDKPVSRQHEIDLFAHYEWPAYWVGGLGGTFTGAPAGYGLSPIPPADYVNAGAKTDEEIVLESREDPHLQSTHSISGYKVVALDGEIGHIDDFVVDDQDWSIRMAVIDTGTWLAGRKVAVAPTKIEFLDEDLEKVHIRLTKAALENSPEFDPSQPATIEFENKLKSYYTTLAVTDKTFLI
jgi:hypothetical protein